MYIGLIRPVEERTVDLTGNSLEEIRDAAHAQLPAGFELVSAPVRMIKGSTALTSKAVFQRRDGIREIDADDRGALYAKVPDGWQMVSVRSV